MTSSMALVPPMPSLRRAEFFAAVVAHDSTALVSLWVGVLSCIEMEVEKEKGKKKAAADGRLVFKENFNIK
jgi:DNA damage-binding protein 1